MSASGVDRTPVGYQVRFYRTKCEIAAPLAINGCCLVTSSNKATWPDFAGRRRTQHAESCILSLYNITPPRHPRDLTDEQWNILEPFIPVPTCREDGRGRPWKDRRAVLNGILWVLRTGAPWADLPKRYPSYQTCHRRGAPRLVANSQFAPRPWTAFLT